MEKIKNVKAMIKSLGDYDQVEIINHKYNNNVVAKYQGNYYTAIFNVFRNCYYVDNVYGLITNFKAFNMLNYK